MRHSLFSIIILITLIGCSTSDSNNMHISGYVKGLKKGTLMLQKFEDTLLVTVDSILVDGNSEFKFSRNIDSPEIYYLYVQLKDGTLRDDRITFFGEEGNIKIETNLKTFGNSARVSGSVNDSILKEYYKLKQRYISKNLELFEKKLKYKTNNDSLIKDIDYKRRSLLANKAFATINFAMNHNDREVAPYLVLSEAFNLNVKYLDTVYNSLQPKIKDSKYGKDLESFIIERKKLDTMTVR